MLCTHKTTILCQFGHIICHQLTDSYLHQFSSIFGGNCIIKSKFSRPRVQAQVFKNKISSSRIKRGQEAQPLSANLKRGQRTHQKEAHSPFITATNMPTTRSQSKLMSTPPISSILEEPECPESTSSQETPWSTQSINNTPPLDNLL